VGAEVKLGNTFLRGGVAYYDNPDNPSVPVDALQPNKNTNAFIYSGGIGFQSKSMYLDFTYRLMETTKYSDFFLSYSEFTEVTQSSFQTTIGFRF
jgi:hypothetical protein